MIPTPILLTAPPHCGHWGSLGPLGPFRWEISLDDDSARPWQLCAGVGGGVEGELGPQWGRWGGPHYSTQLGFSPD